MCYNCGCKRTGCRGCGWNCECDYKTWACFVQQWEDSSTCGYADTVGMFRRRFLCIECQRVWKASNTKYDYECYQLDKNSKCCKCRKSGLPIGSKFRPPKKGSKEWNNVKLFDLEEYCPNFEKIERTRTSPQLCERWRADGKLHNAVENCQNNLKHAFTVPRPILKKGWKK
jgi:hypothetical protein